MSVFADDVDDRGACFRLQVDSRMLLPIVGLPGAIERFDGSLRQNLADLVESLLCEAHIAQNAVGFCSG